MDKQLVRIRLCLCRCRFLDGTAERRPTEYIACASQTVAGEQLASLVFLCRKGPRVNLQCSRILILLLFP